MSQSLIEKALERLAKSADARVVFGEPITAGTRTIVPVARVAYGFGGGFGRRPGETDAAEPSASPDSGGGGGGVAARPMGVLEVTFAGARFIEFGSGRKLAGIFLAGVAAGILLATVRRR